MSIRTNDEVSEGESLSGRRVGLVGFGRIGREFAKLIRPLRSNCSSVILLRMRVG